MAAEFIKDASSLICVGAKPPVSFFAYPGKPSWLTPETAEIVQLADGEICVLDALTRLADSLEAPEAPAHLQPAMIPPIEDGPLNAVEVGKVLAACMPEMPLFPMKRQQPGLPYSRPQQAHQNMTG